MMNDAEFGRFSKFFHEQCGINLPTAKKAMLTSRLQKRLRALNIASFRQYYDYVFEPPGNEDERIKMIDAVTTNRTEFFREAHHFDFLRAEGLPALLQSRAGGIRQHLNLWSAGCSSGQEAYSLAMLMAEFVSERPGVDFTVVATDLSSAMIAIGKRAIYAEQKVRAVPIQIRKKYVMQGKGAQAGYCRIVPELRSRVRFRLLNLMNSDFGFGVAMDIVFCRNVIIYFDRKIQENLFKKIFAQLVPGGFLFIGHAETLDGINSQFVRVAPTIYRKPNSND